jgi:hypothetical protein
MSHTAFAYGICAEESLEEVKYFPEECNKAVCAKSTIQGSGLTIFHKITKSVENSMVF